MSQPSSRPRFLRYLGIELVLLTLAGSIYWWKVAHPNAAEPVPITPLPAASVAANAPQATSRHLPVSMADTPQAAGLTVTPTLSTVTPQAVGARYHLEARLRNSGTKELRQLRFVLECLSGTGERIGVDSFEALGPQDPSVKPGEDRPFTLNSQIDARTNRIQLVVHVRDDAP